MGRFVRRSKSSSDMILLGILGSIASIVGLVLTIVFRIQDLKSHKTKDSNRPTKA